VVGAGVAAGRGVAAVVGDQDGIVTGWAEGKPWIAPRGGADEGKVMAGPLVGCMREAGGVGIEVPAGR
jgi:hypothetical protein